jgi:hypothetical protein
MTTITDYRTDLDGLLATAVDGATWTTALKDEALRLALKEYDVRMVYETSHTVTTPGALQDLGDLPELDDILALAYPWQEGDSFAHRYARWRYINDQVIQLEGRTPRVGEVVRVRHTRLHRIQGLDGAAATTVPARHRRLIGLAAAGWCCDLRRRQVSESPALPGDTARLLVEMAEHYREVFSIHLARAQSGGQLVWAGE